MRGEDLLKLIYYDELTLENGQALQVHINYQKESKGYFTPLMNAIHHNRLSAIRILLILGADPTIRMKVNSKLAASYKVIFQTAKFILNIDNLFPCFWSPLSNY